MTDTSQRARGKRKPKLSIERPSPEAIAQQFELAREVIAALRATEANNIVLRLVRPILGSAPDKLSPFVAEYNTLIAECRRTECRVCKSARRRRVPTKCMNCKPSAYCNAIGDILSKLGEVYRHCQGRPQGRSRLNIREAAKQLAYRLRVAEKNNPRQPVRIPARNDKQPPVAAPAEPVHDAAPPKGAKRSTESGDDHHDKQSVAKLLSVFTNGIADNRLNRAIELVRCDSLRIADKLAKFDALFPIPPTTSAEKLGDLFGVTKQAVMKTPWWVANRKGRKEYEIVQREERYRERGSGRHEPGADYGD